MKIIPSPIALSLRTRLKTKSFQDTKLTLKMGIAIIYYFIFLFCFTFPALAKNWQIDLENSKIEFLGQHSGNEFNGKFECHE